MILEAFYSPETKFDLQKKIFIEQIKLANELGKPLMLHIRSGKHVGGEAAYKDALALLREYATGKGDVHFFAGDWAIAKEWLNIGFTLSFTGVLTFTHDYDEVVKNTPLDMLLSETDAPYITPVPHRGKRNEPIFVSEIVKAMARIKGQNEEDVGQQLIKNAERLFSI